MRVEQFGIGNTKLIGISAIRAIVTGINMPVEIFLPMISVLRSLVTEMIMLVAIVLLMVRINPSPLPLPGIVVTLYLYPDILMIVVVRLKHR